jgi:hypothetical protein
VKIKFCARESCHKVAVGVSRWNPAERPEDRYCREDYQALAMPETVFAEVIGNAEITDVRTQTGVGRGGLVELDPREVNVAHLVYAEHIKIVPAPKKATKTTEPKA